MKKVILLIIVALLVWKGYEKYTVKVAASPKIEQSDLDAQEVVAEATTSYIKPIPIQSFTCDGRTYCSQMKSCEEATYFLQNCPGVKMDGNNDGIPCERQWCK